jgi:hypothetical protein
MSRPRFFTDNDLNDAIAAGVARREALIEILRCRDVGQADWSDDQILAHAADNGLIVVTHDAKTMPATAYGRLAAGQTMTGLLVAHQQDRIGPIIDSLILIWSASEAEEWLGQVRYLPM